MVDLITNFLTADIRTATPLLLAALGLVFSERAGIVNIGTEGIMLIGALWAASARPLAARPWSAR